MSQSLPLQRVADLTQRFVAGLLGQAPSRVEATVASQDGMPVLCAVEAVLGRTLSRATRQELIWLGRTPPSGGHVLRLRAFQADNVVIGDEMHELRT